MPGEKSDRQPQVEYKVVTEPPADTEITVYRISGFIKWFDTGRGYGFIIPDNGMPDVLLHLSCLKRDGFDAPLEGTRVVCDAVKRQKGYQVLKVVDMDASTAIHPVERRANTHVEVRAETGWLEASVKWFNRERGFGFLTEGDGGEDIFVHMEVLRKTAIPDLAPVTHEDLLSGRGPKGRMAAEVRLQLDNGMPISS